MTDDLKSANQTAIWLTRELMPRRLLVAGRSGIDPDCLVAYEDGSASPLLIVESSGFVCGLNVRARLEENHDD